MGRRRTDPAPATGTECQPQLAIQGQRSRRQAQHPCHVHERVIRLVQIGLPATVLYVVSKLDATEAKGLSESLGRDVRAVAVIHAYTRRISGAAVRGHFLHLFQLFCKLILVLGQVGARRLDIGEVFQVHVPATHLLADVEARHARTRVDIKVHVTLWLGALPLFSDEPSKLRDRVLGGVTATEHPGPVSLAGRRPALHGPHRASWVITHTREDCVMARFKRDAPQTALVTLGLVKSRTAVDVAQLAGLFEAGPNVRTRERAA
ncbi:hypothetical protein D3C71_1216670 [compost metagenome]